jgi:hypothetical protein
MNYPWNRWSIVGGEPTTHPDLDVIIKRAMQYRKRHRPHLRVILASHGCGEETQQRLASLTRRYPRLKILNSHKQKGMEPSNYDAMCVEPEVEPGHRYTGCCISRNCGMGMNYRGFYLCAMAGAIDRVMQTDHAVQRLSEVTEAVMTEQCQLYCRLCGHYRPISAATQPPMSPAWQAAIGPESFLDAP